MSDLRYHRVRIITREFYRTQINLFFLGAKYQRFSIALNKMKKGRIEPTRRGISGETRHLRREKVRRPLEKVVRARGVERERGGEVRGSVHRTEESPRARVRARRGCIRTRVRIDASAFAEME